MNGVTGRMGMNQHLVRSILAIREQGGLPRRRDVLWPEPILVGRSERKLAALAERTASSEWPPTSTPPSPTPPYEIYFDAQVTAARDGRGRGGDRRRQAHLLREAVTADAADGAGAGPRWRAMRASRTASSRTSCSCPGCSSSSGSSTAASSGGSSRCAASSATGSSRATGSRSGRPGTTAPRTAAASSSTCSRTGGTCWTSCSAGARPSAPGRHPHPGSAGTSTGSRYEATADDAAYAIFELEGGADRADQLVLVRARLPRRAVRVPGRRHEGSAVAGLRDCRVQPAVGHPKPVWNPDIPDPDRPSATSGTRCPRRAEFDNGFKAAVGAVPAPRRRSTSRSPGTSSRAPAASSSPSWACSRGASAAGSTCRSCAL